MNDIGIIKERLRETHLPLNEDIHQYISGLQPDGSWTQIDYTINFRNRWPASDHLKRTKALSQIYCTPQSQWYQDESLKEAICSALRFWFDKDYRNPNWWFNDIGVPTNIGDILILMEASIPDDLFEKGLAVIKRGDFENRNLWTGQNLVWGIWNNIRRGLLEKDSSLILRAIDRIQNESLRITWHEGGIPANQQGGIQLDYSFHQHGHILYSGGYGRNFTLDCVRLAHIVRGTEFEMCKDSMDILSHYMLDGQQWMTRKGTFDYSVVGREITRAIVNHAQSLAEMCEKMVDISNVTRKEEFKAFANRLNGAQDDFCGNRHFWKSDIMVHHRKGFYTSVKMVSARTVGTECVIEEGLQSYHLSDGCTFLYQTGKEYDLIFPVWDWRRIPGATIEQTDGPLPRLDRDVKAVGITHFVGGVSDGMVGCAVMDHEKCGLKAQKAWFYFDREFVALGNGITCTTGNEVFTSLNQCHLNGKVYVGDGEGVHEVPSGAHSFDTAQWVHHDGVGYIFPNQVSVHLNNDIQTGNWKDISNARKDEPVSMDVFSLWLNHGTNIKNTNYAYIVVPNASIEAVKEYSKNKAVHILHNTTKLQAVWHKDILSLQSVFWEPGSITTPHGMELTVDQPCLMMVNEKGSEVQISVSNPLNQPLSISITINRKLMGDKCTSLAQKDSTLIELQLPSGEYAGQSLVHSFSV